MILDKCIFSVSFILRVQSCQPMYLVWVPLTKSSLVNLFLNSTSKKARVRPCFKTLASISISSPNQAALFQGKTFHKRHPKLDGSISPHYQELSDFFIFFKISEHRAFKNWAHFHKINYFKMTSYDILPIIKVILLFTYCMVKIIFREIWIILVTENLL